MDEESRETVYTLDEAAAALRMTNRGVAKVAKRHGLCMVNGRHILLTGADIEGIKEALRVGPKEPRKRLEPSLSDYQRRKRLAELTRKKAPTSSSRKTQQSNRPSRRQP